MTTIELTDEQLQLVRIVLAAYAQQLDLESREFTYSSIVERRRELVRELQQLLELANNPTKITPD